MQTRIGWMTGLAFRVAAIAAPSPACGQGEEKEGNLRRRRASLYLLAEMRRNSCPGCLDNSSSLLVGLFHWSNGLPPDSYYPVRPSGGAASVD